MNKRVKRFLEYAFLDKIWIEKVARKSDIAALIKKLKPTPNPGGLRRFGPTSDGGYLIPDDLEGVVACISPGVGFNCGFEEEIASRGIDVYMADASVEEPPTKNSRFHFFPKFVDITSTDQTLTLDELCRWGNLRHSAGDLILQMDIEGAEYRVLANMSDDLLKRFRILVVEFHDLDLMFSRFAFNIIRPVFEKLTAFHRVVHIHPNNCSRLCKRGTLKVPSVMEFTFYRKDRVPHGSVSTLAYPHPLDADCLPTRPSLALPDCWWR
jgi:hypothetical protein